MHLTQPHFSTDHRLRRLRPYRIHLLLLCVALLCVLPACVLAPSIPRPRGNPFAPRPTVRPTNTRIPTPTPTATLPPVAGQLAVVTDVIDGDTIDVEIDGEEFRVRYVGVNTPERDEPCYWEAWQANRRLVEGQIVTLVRDVSDTDRYGRLLRYVYLGGLPINETLVREGYAEVVVYGDDDRFAASFQELEEAASRRNLNCHATGIFNDGSYVR